MPIIVNKEQKRKDIALSCCELLHEKGIKKLTVAEVANTAGVAKGSIYDYFQNKEDIVFEIIRHHIDEYQKDFEAKIDQNATTREKIFLLFGFLLEDSEQREKDHSLYKEYMSIDLGSENEKMSGFNAECSDFFRSVFLEYLQNGVNKGELKKESIKLVDGLLAVEKGFLILSWTEQRDIKKELTQFLNTLFDLIEIKK